MRGRVVPVTQTLVQAAEAVLCGALEPALATYPEGPQLSFAKQASLHGTLQHVLHVNQTLVFGRMGTSMMDQLQNASNAS